ncbi:hypothetical protein ANN_23635 [Periplaneta americana]|uniref:Uncharacterized protein n=1 Tax=Periplaneta americana TaxID=6978 RepID=A0ABQ8SMQ2_PERAM|nr:hypothetical protein ANN_23635 [Periplaneta americana]
MQRKRKFYQILTSVVFTKVKAIGPSLTLYQVTKYTSITSVTSYVDEIIGDHQCDFREYAIRNVQENREGLEFNVLHHLCLFLLMTNILGKNLQTIRNNRKFYLKQFSIMKGASLSGTQGQYRKAESRLVIVSRQRHPSLRVLKHQDISIFLYELDFEYV